MKSITLRKKGKKPITFHEGGLHATTHTPMGEKIPHSKVMAAARGAYGAKGKKQVQFMRNILTGPK